jgi:hypothetical protein
MGGSGDIATRDRWGQDSDPAMEMRRDVRVDEQTVAVDRGSSLSLDLEAGCSCRVLPRSSGAAAPAIDAPSDPAASRTLHSAPSLSALALKKIIEGTNHVHSLLKVLSQLRDLPRRLSIPIRRMHLKQLCRLSLR